MATVNWFREQPKTPPPAQIVVELSEAEALELKSILGSTSRLFGVFMGLNNAIHEIAEKSNGLTCSFDQVSKRL